MSKREAASSKTSGKRAKAAVGAPLAKLRAEFDALVARMQTPKAKAGVKRLFAASGKELGAIAQAHAKTGSAPKLADRSVRLDNLLKQHRRKTGLSANDVADRAEIGRSYYFEIEQGKRANINLLMAARLSLVLNIALDDLAEAALKSVSRVKK